MNLRKELLRENSKEHITRLAELIVNDSNLFAELIDLMLTDNNRICQRAAHTMSKCIDTHPELLIPHVDNVLSNLSKNPTVAVKRNSLRVLQFITLPKRHWASLCDICLEALSSQDEPVAIKVFAMTNIYNLTDRLPELKQELRIILEDQMPYGSVGYRSRASKILKAIS